MPAFAGVMETEPASPAGKGERGIWQRRYWEHTLRDENDFVRHLDYIHFNQVKHGYAARVQDWPTPRFTAGSGSAPIPQTGRATPRRMSTLSAKVMGFAGLNPSYVIDAVICGNKKYTQRPRAIARKRTKIVLSFIRRLDCNSTFSSARRACGIMAVRTIPGTCFRLKDRLRVCPDGPFLRRRSRQSYRALGTSRPTQAGIS